MKNLDSNLGLNSSNMNLFLKIREELKADLATKITYISTALQIKTGNKVCSTDYCLQLSCSST